MNEEKREQAVYDISRKEGKSSPRVHGISREDEEKQLVDIIQVAQENLERTEMFHRQLTDELKDILETYGAKDKEALALWHNTESQLQETKHDLIRCQKARKKPYFGRIDFKDPKMSREESYYVGRVGIAKSNVEPLVIDWRAPVASIYYENNIGPCTYEVKNQGIYEIDLTRKRTYEIANDQLVDFFDSDVVANDDLLTKYLAKSKKAVLGEIIGTIQKEQNAIIRKSPKTNLIVQGVAGSGKTTVAMHRISYILYNYEMFCPEDFYIIGSNRILLNYITSVLPDLDVYGISQMTMEQLFVRLIYEDWDPKIQKIGSLNKKDELACIKGSYGWFHDLEEFCREYEKTIIPREDVCIQKNGVQLLSAQRIESYIKENQKFSMQTKINMLNELLLTKLENELCGRYVSYTPEEKKELERLYRFYFGKDEWKGSIYDLYDDFLEVQKRKGTNIVIENHTYDVYDLAALAYLYKRIKEIDGIREASHVIIDEAQDFGMMAYGALNYCLRGCTYTIMGDVSQNIHYGYGLNDWEDLKNLILTGTYDSFGLLKKSYRNTVEISNFATEILRHGSFSIYPVEPIIRHGNDVCVIGFASEEQMLQKTVDTILKWQQEGHETIAVVCRDEKEALKVGEQLRTKITLTDSNLETAEFNQGVMVLPVEYTKGLEFDAVLIYDPSKESYPAQDQYVKLLYVAATRALHELAVVHLNDLTDLIAKPVSMEKKMQLLESEKDPKLLRYKGKEESGKEQETLSEEKSLLEQEILEEKKRLLEKKSVAGKENNTGKETLPLKGTQSGDSTQNSIGASPLRGNSVNKSNATPINRPLQLKTDAPKNESAYQFGDVVSSSMLSPKGHSRIDSSIRWAKKSKSYVDFVSSYGTLRLTPVGDEVIRVQFQKGQAAEFIPGYWNYEPENPITWNAREGKTQFEVATNKVILRIDKKTGALQFYTKQGVLLLAEKSALPRQMEMSGLTYQTWNYFDWQKNDKINAKGILDDELERMNQKARYISFGKKSMRMPLLTSDKGYGLGVAAEDTVMCCNIAIYGPYVYTEKMTQIDYYFIYGGEYDKTLQLYKGLAK